MLNMINSRHTPKKVYGIINARGNVGIMPKSRGNTQQWNFGFVNHSFVLPDNWSSTND